MEGMFTKERQRLSGPREIGKQPTSGRLSNLDENEKEATIKDMQAFKMFKFRSAVEERVP